MRSARLILRPDIQARPPRWLSAVILALGLAVSVWVPAAGQSPTTTSGPDIVVTSAVLGAVVQDLVGDRAAVTLLMGSGVDPHDWSPSAQDVEAIEGADLVVVNGLGLETGLQDVLARAVAHGVPVFTASDHVVVRVLDATPSDTPATGSDGQGPGALDPHLWLDPLSMRDVVLALGPVVTGMGADVSDRQADLVARLEALDAEVRTILEVVPPERRMLVTGHQSMGYFADRYGFRLIGTVIPGLSSQGEVSARQLSAIVAAIREHGVPAILAETGTPQAVVDAIASETGVRVVQVPTHALPADGSYLTFIRDIANAVASALG